MDEVVFWEVIEQSKEESEDFTHQINLLTYKLSLLPKMEIIEFEYRLREMLVKSAHYNIMAAAKIINGYVSDDSFLYFRCRLIAEGKTLFFNTIENPDYLADQNILEIEFGGEDMIYVTDQAFMKKFGEDTEKELPRDVANDFLNYDEGGSILGEDWTEQDLPIRFPLLWEKYKNQRIPSI